MLHYVIGALVLGLTSSKIIENEMLNSNIKVEKPIDTVSIIMPSLNEEQYIESSVKSIRNQSIIQRYPENFEFILVDSGSIDNTVKLAEPYVDRIINSPKGKLTARNIGTLNSKGNIIVSVDADTIYSKNWLNSLILPFKDPSTIAVVGSTIDEIPPFIPRKLYIIAATADRYTIHSTQMVGRNSAYYKHAFYLSGLFNTEINQKDVSQMLDEEEIGFGRRLSKYGKIQFSLSASCIHLGGDRISCRFGWLPADQCDRYKLGTERF